MKITVRVQVDAVETGAVPAPEDEGEATEQFSEVFVLERDQLTGASVGLSLAEAHALLASIQEAVVCAQVTAALAEQRCCARCGRAYRHKDTRTITVRVSCSGRCTPTAHASWPARVEPMPPRRRPPSAR